MRLASQIQAFTHLTHPFAAFFDRASAMQRMWVNVTIRLCCPEQDSISLAGLVPADTGVAGQYISGAFTSSH
jgi:hypothetical protein